MLIGDLLDGGGRGVAQAVATAALLVLVLLGLVVVIPAAILTSVLPGVHLSAPAVSAPGPPPSEVTGGSDGLPPAIGGGAVDVARRYLGVRYVFGGTNPAVGLDCSGLVQLVFRQLGVALPRTAQQQYDATVRVNRADLQPGDLVFFARTYADPHDWVTHVGIYIGNGQQINAPTEGQVVSIQPVFSGFWGEHFTGGGRPHHG
jgi:cell wall-associated NlpC family hydrolase